MSKNKFEILDNAKDIDELSLKIRQFLFNDDAKIHDKLEKIISGLKNIKIAYFTASAVPSVDGFVKYDNADGYATIYLSDGLAKEDRNFTLMHEFGHLIFDFRWSFSEGKPRRSFSEENPRRNLLIHSRTDIEASNSYSERRVNEFAASFLIPYVKDSEQRLSTMNINELVEHYGVSSLVIERRKKMFKEFPLS